MLTIAALQQLPTAQYKVLLTVVPPYPSRDGEEARNLLQQKQVSLFRGVIRRYVAFQKAALAGCLVRDVADPKAPSAWRDYQSIVQEIEP